MQSTNLLPLLLLAIPSMALKSSFTWYGSGDWNGSPNCATTTNACGDPGSGYTAAVSQQQFGAGPGEGAGPGCNTCYVLTIQTDESGNPVEQKIVKIRVNNLCPVQGNPKCDVPNQFGADIHFDLCTDSGARDALFSNGNGSGVGTAEMVDC